MATTPIAAGEQLLVAGRYRVLGVLGRGGYGTVYRAYDQLLKREVALKELPCERAGVPREAVAAGRLSHPAIAVLYELLDCGGSLYLIYELVEGSSLAVALAEGRLSLPGLRSALLDLCEALRYAHAQGVVHGDVSAANLLVLADPLPGQPRAKLTDFGAAILAEEWGLRPAAIATPGYAAPELLAGKPLSPAADVYAAARLIETAVQAVLGTVPQPLQRALAAALAEDPAARCSIEELRAALLALPTEAPVVLPTAPLPTQPLPPPPRKRRTILLLWTVPAFAGAAAFLALTGKGGWAVLLLATLPAIGLALLLAPLALLAPVFPTLGLPLLAVWVVGQDRRALSRAVGGALCGWLVLLLAPLASRPSWPPLPGGKGPGPLSLPHALSLLAAATGPKALVLVLLCAAAALLFPLWRRFRRARAALAFTALWSGTVVLAAALLFGATPPMPVVQGALPCLLLPLLVLARPPRVG